MSKKDNPVLRSPKKTKKTLQENSPLILPVLPLRDIVVFPGMMIPLFIGRPRSLNTLEVVLKKDKKIFLITQKSSQNEEPKKKDLYRVGVIANVVQFLRLPDNTVKLLLEGVSRGTIKEYLKFNKIIEAKIALIPESPYENEAKIAGMIRGLMTQFSTYARIHAQIPSDTVENIAQMEDPYRLINTIAGHVDIGIIHKQKLLEQKTLESCIEKLIQMLQREIQTLQVEKRIKNRVHTQMEKTQKEYFLNEQIKAIQKELGNAEDNKDGIQELKDRIAKTNLTAEAEKKVNSELKKLQRMNLMSGEATVVRNYIDWILSIPWKKKAIHKINLLEAKNILHARHYALDKVKERIVEFMAVSSRTKTPKSPILCLFGPPGVGKTSLARSIALASKREFARLSLGGIRDEAELRGHRRTYVGAMPGRIIQSMKKVKSLSPVILLDEIDKIGSDFRSDPEAALLEILDPEQNTAFSDHYLEMDYDLSGVLFITTANTLDISAPLLDRMEVIRLSGYTEQEKRQIAIRHLLPKVRVENGLKEWEWHISDSVLINLIRHYTNEAGVRELERKIATLARKATTKIVLQEQKKGKKDTHKRVVRYRLSSLKKVLGPPRYNLEDVNEENRVGVVTGLAWTPSGGSLLTIEGIMFPGKGKMIVTGNLREVMKESIKAAHSYTKSHAPQFGMIPTLLDCYDIHVHVPEGATPKDGPSAGIAMVTAIVSLISGIPVKRKTAMTGEITLRGRVLPIGGLKEKLLAALRGNIEKVLIPKDNEKDLHSLPDAVINGLEIVLVSDVFEIFKFVLTKPLRKIDWDIGSYTENSKQSLLQKKNVEIRH